MEGIGDDYDKSVGSHWEYVVGGLSLVAGAALMFVPGGQVAGMGLISFGADVVIQKATKGTVNWALSAAMGAVGLLGGAALTAGRAAAATASSASRLGSYVAVNAGVNGAAGAVGGGVTYLVKHGGRVDSWRGFAGSVAGGRWHGKRRRGWAGRAGRGNSGACRWLRSLYTHRSRCQACDTSRGRHDCVG